MILRLGTRASALARWQAQWVAAQLRQRGVDVELTPIATTGDRQQGAIGALGGQGFFTKEIQQALLDGRIDLAVHSLKDLPTGTTPGLALAAVPERWPVADVLVCSPHTPCADLAGLPPGAVVGTGSLRRRAQLLHVRRDLVMKDVRGNVETRLRKLEQGDFDALILAEAGLRRLGLLTNKGNKGVEGNKGVGSLYFLEAGPPERVADKDSRPRSLESELLPLELMLPAVGQGALALETRGDDRATCQLVADLDHPPAHVAVLAERAMMAALQGGCLAPIAALGRVDGEHLTLTGRVMSHDGVELLEARETTKLPAAFTEAKIFPSPFGETTSLPSPFGRGAGGEGSDDAAQLGRKVAEALLAQGAGELIQASRTT